MYRVFKRTVLVKFFNSSSNSLLLISYKSYNIVKTEGICFGKIILLLISKFCEGYKPWRNGEITSRECFKVVNMSFSAIRENKNSRENF